MDKGERIALWAVTGVLALWLLALTLIAAGERADDALAPLPTQEPAPPAAWWDEGGASGQDGPQVRLAGVCALQGTLALTASVRSSGAGDLLVEPPVLVDESGRSYPVTGESLEAARYAFLDLVTRGQAETVLEFAGTPPAGARLTLVFNPGQRPGDALSPRVEVPVPIPGGVESP